MTGFHNFGPTPYRLLYYSIFLFNSLFTYDLYSLIFSFLIMHFYSFFLLFVLSLFFIYLVFFLPSFGSFFTFSSLFLLFSSRPFSSSSFGLFFCSFHFSHVPPPHHLPCSTCFSSFFSLLVYLLSISILSSEITNYFLSVCSRPEKIFLKHYCVTSYLDAGTSTYRFGGNEDESNKVIFLIERGDIFSFKERNGTNFTFH